MAIYKRKRITRRVPLNKRRRYNMSGKSRTRSSSGRVVSFKRTFCVGNITPSTASTAGFWQYQSYAFNQMPSNTEFTALFDQYKLNGFKTVWRPRFDSFAGNDTTDTTLPGTTAQGGANIHIINDPTSTITPTGTYTYTTLNTFLENGSVRSHTGNKPFSVYVKPMVPNQLSGGTNRVRSPWIDVSNPGVIHNGFHYFIQDTNMTGVFNQSWDIFVTFYFQCRGMK